MGVCGQEEGGGSHFLIVTISTDDTGSDEHHGIGLGKFLGHIEEEIIGESVDVLYLVALLEHEHEHAQR